jgi:hypothetical protein
MIFTTMYLNNSAMLGTVAVALIAAFVYTNNLVALRPLAVVSSAAVVYLHDLAAWLNDKHRRWVDLEH